MIKIALQFLKNTKWLSWATSLFSGVRIWLLVGGLATGYFVVLKYQLSNAKEDLETRTIELSVVKAANLITNQSLDLVLAVNNECAAKWTESQAQNQHAVATIQRLENEKIPIIHEIIQAPPVTECDSQPVDGHFDDWMRGKPPDT